MQTISWHAVTKAEGIWPVFYLDHNESVGGFNLMAQQLSPNSTGLFRTLGRLPWGVWEDAGLREILSCAVLVCYLFRSLVYLR